MMLGGTEEEENEPHTHLPVELHPLVFAPNVPPPIQRKHPARVKINMTVDVIEKPIDATHIYECWTFNGEVRSLLNTAHLCSIYTLVTYLEFL